MPKTPVIALKNVSKKYVLGGNEIPVLNGVDLEIHSGEYVIFFGPSGSGKSTILNTICGLEPPTTGEVVVRGENIAKFNSKQLAKYRRDKIGIVFQQFNLIKSFKVWENVAFPLTNDREPLKRRRERAISILNMLGLSKFVDRHPNELSGGQQQRVAIARALATNAWIVIADEPTGNLDSRSANDVMTVFKILNQKSRRTIIMVTHNPEYLKEADRVFFVRDGLIEKIQVNRHVESVGDDVKGLEDLKEMVFHDEKEAEKKAEKPNLRQAQVGLSDSRTAKTDPPAVSADRQADGPKNEKEDEETNKTGKQVSK